jgi:quercetin dioxygenase-like cupin family protein
MAGQGQALLDERTPYERWIENEGLRVVKGFFIEDLRSLPLDDWQRKGGKGVFINLEGTGDTDDAYVCEIPPGRSLKPQRHLYEEIILILSGRGATTVWNDGGPKQTFEWQEGSLFSPPLNAWHEHFNGQGDRPVRYLAVTTAPLVMNLFHNEDFILRNPHIFIDRFDSQEGYFASQGKTIAPRIWQSNFIPDVRGFRLVDYKERGAGGTNIKFELSENTLTAHISEFPVATYKKAHRHGPGAHVIILGGEGYSLVWPEGAERKKVDWHTGSMFVPPDRWFHQHFNTGKDPARYLALRWGSVKHRFGRSFQTAVNIREGGDQIEYEDENPEIRRLFTSELAKKGLSLRM